MTALPRPLGTMARLQAALLAKPRRTFAQTADRAVTLTLTLGAVFVVVLLIAESL